MYTIPMKKQQQSPASPFARLLQDWRRQQSPDGSLITFRRAEELTNVPAANWSDYEKGKRKPTHLNLFRLSKAMNRPLSNLAELAGHPVAHSLSEGERQFRADQVAELAAINPTIQEILAALPDLTEEDADYVISTIETRLRRRRS